MFIAYAKTVNEFNVEDTCKVLFYNLVKDTVILIPSEYIRLVIWLYMDESSVKVF